MAMDLATSAEASGHLWGMRTCWALDMLVTGPFEGSHSSNCSQSDGLREADEFGLCEGHFYPRTHKIYEVMHGTKISARRTTLHQLLIPTTTRLRGLCL